MIRRLGAGPKLGQDTSKHSEKCFLGFDEICYMFKKLVDGLLFEDRGTVLFKCYLCVMQKFAAFLRIKDAIEKKV